MYVRASYADATGKRHYCRRRADNKTHARLILKALLEEIDQKLSRPVDARSTFADLAAWYEQTQAIDPVYVDDNKMTGLRGKRTVLYRLALLREAFGECSLDTITYDQIKAYKLDRLKQKTPRGTFLKLPSVHRELALLRRLLQLAVQRGWLAKNPFFSGEPLIIKTHERRRRRVMSLEEETRLLIYCRDFREHMQGIITAAVDTGMRAGELFSLRWSDVNISKREITIQALNTKVLYGRTVPISDRLAKILRWRWQYRQTENDPVFGVTRSVATAWRTLCRLADVKGLRLHDLRHTFASRMAAEDVHPFTIALIMGHSLGSNPLLAMAPSDLSMTFSYTHLTPEMAQKVIAALNRVEDARIHAARMPVATNASHKH